MVYKPTGSKPPRDRDERLVHAIMVVWYPLPIAIPSVGFVGRGGRPLLVTVKFGLEVGFDPTERSKIQNRRSVNRYKLIRTLFRLITKNSFCNGL